MYKYIFTSDKNSGQMAFNEIKDLISGSKLIGFISPGIGLVETDVSFPQVSEILNNGLCAFVRHICPVDFQFEFTDADALVEILSDYCIKNLSESGTFSFQSRLYNCENMELRKNYINGTCANILTTKGYTLDVQSPQYIISVVIQENTAYVGISQPEQNISPWAGGGIRFKKYDDFVSRAEFKLLEALDVFKIDLSNKKNALDLGAAPGGWTKVLIDRGLFVTAVDPADLDDRIAKHGNVTHFKGLAQDFFKTVEKYDIIVNDMKMDALESIDIMIQAKNHLTTDGIIIMTLKLKNTHTQKQFNKAFKILLREFRILGVRQLYHNRSEVTVALGRLDE